MDSQGHQKTNWEGLSPVHVSALNDVLMGALRMGCTKEQAEIVLCTAIKLFVDPKFINDLRSILEPLK